LKEKVMPHRSPQTAELIDAFLYFNEMALLKVRLEYLGPVVSEFWIIESNIDFAGKPRNFALTPEVVSQLPYFHKIKVHQWHAPWFLRGALVPLAKRVGNRKGIWKIQDMQRNVLLKALHHKSPDDLLLFGDLDELPSIEDLGRLRTAPPPALGTVFSFEQPTVYYNIHNSPARWKGTTFSSIATARRLTPNQLRKHRERWPTCGEGWHFSYFGSAQQVKEKVGAIARAEKLKEFEDVSVDYIQGKIDRLQNIYATAPATRRTRNPSELQYPQLLLDLLRKYLPESVKPPQ
jgi:beta-1,4-mannosyl-glycoprotein beta-1,4-N-acetylglucosaminyltransferase